MLVHDQVNMYINIIDVNKILKTHILFIKFLKCSTPTFLTLSEHEEIVKPLLWECNQPKNLANIKYKTMYSTFAEALT